MSSVTVGSSRELMAPVSLDAPRRQLVAFVTDSWKANATNVRLLLYTITLMVFSHLYWPLWCGKSQSDCSGFLGA